MIVLNQKLDFIRCQIPKTGGGNPFAGQFVYVCNFRPGEKHVLKLHRRKKDHLGRSTARCGGGNGTRNRGVINSAIEQRGSG